MVTINKIDFDNRYVTLTLSASDVNTLCNALHQYIKEHENYADLEILHQGIYAASSICKNGCLDSVAINHLTRLQSIIDELNNQKVKE